MYALRGRKETTMYSGAAVFLLILLVCFYLDSLRSGLQRSHVSHADEREIERSIRRLDRQERLRSLSAAYQQPWPWWFLGSCLAFAGLSVLAGIAGYPDPDANVLLVIGPLFLLAFAFKAWGQEQARQEPPREPPTPQ
jgi:hypothetical protein